MRQALRALCDRLLGDMCLLLQSSESQNVRKNHMMFLRFYRTLTQAVSLYRDVYPLCAGNVIVAP